MLDILILKGMPECRNAASHACHVCPTLFASVVCSVWSCSLLASLACTDLRMSQARLGFRIGCWVQGLWMSGSLDDQRVIWFICHKKEKSKAKSIIKSERWWNKVVLSSLCFPATCSKMYKKRMFKTLLLAFSRLSSVLRSRIASLNPRKTNYHEPKLKVLAAQCQTITLLNVVSVVRLRLRVSRICVAPFHELAREDFACSRPSTEKVYLEGDYHEIWFYVRLCVIAANLGQKLFWFRMSVLNETTRPHRNSVTLSRTVPWGLGQCSWNAMPSQCQGNAKGLRGSVDDWMTFLLAEQWT